MKIGVGTQNLTVSVRELGVDIHNESEPLEQVKSKRRTLEGDILKMKLDRDNSFRKLE